MLFRFGTHNVSLVNLFELIRVQARDDAVFQVAVAGFLEKALVRNQAGVAVVDLNPPGDALLVTLADQGADILLAERFDTEKAAVNGNAVAAVADHVLKAELLHIGQGHALGPAGGDA